MHNKTSFIKSELYLFHLKAQKNNHFDNLKLALQWNRIDIAKSDIFTGDEHLSSEQLSKLLEIALIENKTEFVKLCKFDYF
jgi:transient receptor potential cation channel subfamily M protein 2